VAGHNSSMNSPPLPPLPIVDVLPNIVSALETQAAVVLRAPTGAGKTTRVPPMVLSAHGETPGQIIMLEPRRLAARAAATRMAQEFSSPLGQDVGYQVRFDSKAGPRTRILVVTEGILLRRLQKDPFLEGVHTVIFDEFHERNLASDLALGMVRRIQQTVRPDLKIIVMSATLDPTPIADYLEGAAVVESLGRSFPVEIQYLRHRELRAPVELAARGVQQVFPQTSGHVLVFLPGVGEIFQLQRELDTFARNQGAVLLPLYGDLPAAAQDAVLAPQGERKIVLATNVAETSVTIPDVTAVVDLGLVRTLRFDPDSGLDRLVLEPVSQASADQRAGRAGRTGPGICLRLWEEATQRHRPAQTDPEIRRVDLSGPILQLKCWGEQDVLGFPWLEPPRPEAVEQAELLLSRLGALDSSAGVTPLGMTLAELPVHPRMARLLLAGHQAGESQRVAWLAAMLEERSPFSRARPSHGTGRAPPTVLLHHSQSDPLDRLAALEEFDRTGAEEFPWGTLHRGGWKQILRVRDQLLQLLKGISLEEIPSHTRPAEEDPDEALCRALVAAFPDRVARRRSSGSDQGVMVGGRGVKLAAQSAVRSGDLFLCVDVDAGQSEALVRQASLVKSEWLPESSLKTETELFFHPSQKQVIARKRLYYEDLVLSESPVPLPQTDAAGELLFQEARRAWNEVFPVQDAAVQGYLQRVAALAQWMPELGLPSFDEAQQLEILHTLCRSCRSFSELRKADWLTSLQGQLSWPMRQIVDKEAPATWTVPSGSQIHLQYEAGHPPILAVRIQEIFGMSQTPRIAGGRISVLLHLLAPNRQPQQVTDDLASFWEKTYPIVRKEMARRYPRHPWPEDPLTAKAIRK